MNDSQKHGGKRPNAGRPRKYSTLAKDATTTVRVTHAIASDLKSGKYQLLTDLVAEYEAEVNSNPKSKTSPRYDKLREFLTKINQEKNTY